MTVDKEFSDFYQDLYGQPLAEPNDEEDVKKILGCIRAQHGSLDSEEEHNLQSISPILQRKMSLIARNSRQVLARFTNAISNQLYDDSFRFFFELIQNADDAKYFQTKAKPAMVFLVLPNELRVDINEDGFTLEDVLSLCATGQRSKKLDEESTGKKGVGFKSVFGVADRVHVQSGLWSFHFEHKRHQDGLGMITPIWEQREELPDGVQTRFRLRYFVPKENSTDTVSDIWARLEAQHASILFALRKLMRISINFQDIEGRIRTISFEKSFLEDSGITKITKSVAGSESGHFYRTFSMNLGDMPNHIERPNTVSRIKIGFPVTAHRDGKPLINADGQFVFARLPVMQTAQLPFIIQADFLLPASRQSINDNRWNRRLRNGIAELFAIAAKEITLEKSKLSYEWLAFIPQHMSGFWRPLPGLIHQRLSSQKLLYGRNESLYESRNLRVPIRSFMHNGKPLLPASGCSWQFLSSRYKSSVTSTLKLLGVPVLSFTEALKLVYSDTKLVKSTIHRRPLSDRWHMSLLYFIQAALKDPSSKQYKDQIRKMLILPVRNQGELRWQQPWQTIYFPTIVDEWVGPERVKIELPKDLDLIVLDPDAARESQCRKVYKSLGVCHCPVKLLCDSIEQAQMKPGTKYVDDMLRHFELLFWFSHKISSNVVKTLVADTSGVFYGDSNGLFMRSHEPYHAEQLLRLAENPKYNEHFLSTWYQASSVSVMSHGGRTWEQWLCDVAGVRWYPTLVDPSDRKKLHWMIECVRDENPTAFVSMIQHYWADEYSNTCKSRTRIKDLLSECRVLCQNGGFTELKTTWFPSSRIVETARAFGVEKALPILSLPESTQDYSIYQWPSLTELGVRSFVDLSYYKEILSLISTSDEAPSIGIDGMTRLYHSIGALATLDDQANLRDDFKTNSLIWDPCNGKWRNLEECAWKSGISLLSKFVLTSKYDQELTSRLFSILLKVGDITLEGLIEELEFLKGAGPSEPAETLVNQTYEIYALINNMAQNAKQKLWVRSIFTKKSLIYNSTGSSKQWLRSTSCLWHGAIKIENLVPIASVYPELEDFFVNILGIRVVTDKIMMNRLAAKAGDASASIDEIKSLMLWTSGMLSLDSESSQFVESMDILRQSKFLPCRLPSGQSIFCSRDQTFFIVDNELYAHSFRRELILLDFAYEQLNSLHALFLLLRLDDRYLGRHVIDEISANTSTVDDALTDQFRQCAYAISCCAIAHFSPVYSNQSKRMHDDLVNVIVETSADMSAQWAIVQDNTTIRVTCDRPLSYVAREETGLIIVLPFDEKERMQVMRNLLPWRLLELLEVANSSCERQIYRIINELESDTDEILVDEAITPVSWLAKTRRPAPALELGTVTPQLEFVGSRCSTAVHGEIQEV